MVQGVEELEPELGVEPLLEREVLEYREVHVLEARVAEDVPAHRAIGSGLVRNHHRVALHDAAAGVERTEVGGHRLALPPHRGGLGGGKGAHDAGDAAGYTAIFGASTE